MFRSAAIALFVIMASVSAAFAVSVPQEPIPEPSSLLLLAGGVGASLLYVRSRRRRKK
jgi:hypothetical protein